MCAKWWRNDRWFLTALKSGAHCWVYQDRSRHGCGALERQLSPLQSTPLQSRKPCLSICWSMYPGGVLWETKFQPSFAVDGCVFINNFWTHSSFTISFDRESNGKDTEFLHILGKQVNGWQSDSVNMHTKRKAALNTDQQQGTRMGQRWYSCPTTGKLSQSCT